MRFYTAFRCFRRIPSVSLVKWLWEWPPVGHAKYLVIVYLVLGQRVRGLGMVVASDHQEAVRGVLAILLPGCRGEADPPFRRKASLRPISRAQSATPSRVLVLVHSEIFPGRRNLGWRLLDALAVLRAKEFVDDGREHGDLELQFSSSKNNICI